MKAQHKPLRHFLSIEQLDQATLSHLFEITDTMIDSDMRTIKKIPLLQGATVTSLFFEPSTRTRTSFEIAAKRLSADYLNLSIESSSASKGESILDTLYNLQAMQTDVFVIRHNVSGMVEHLSQYVAPHVHLINAGDGSHAHPTQALLDMYTIRHYKKSFSGLKVAIIGDVIHSRVAKSQIQALKLLGVQDIRAIGPTSLLPDHLDAQGVAVHHNLQQGLKDVDVVITLRLQRERFANPAVPTAEMYFRDYGLTPSALAHAKPDAIVMHPGPMNRGVEIVSEVADGPQSVILQQVTFGIATRMAVMAYLMGHNHANETNYF